MPDHELQFVNRTEELTALCRRIPPYAPASMATILRSPSGYGKSRLTDRLLEGVEQDGPSCIVVDPEIRTRYRSDRIYPWFFVQRAADPSALRPIAGQPRFRDFGGFVRRTQYSRINWKHAYENAKESISPGKILRFTIDLLENIMKRGRYNPAVLLKDDSTFATSLAADYVRALADFRPVVFVVRECQNIDLESLRFFLSLHEDRGKVGTILEYTSPDSRFAADHEKVILESAEPARLAIFDLLRLDKCEFVRLLQQTLPGSAALEVGVDLQWDGNLRIIRELKYRVMVGGTAAQNAPMLVRPAIRENFSTLTRRQQLILAILAAHVEALELTSLHRALQRLEPAAPNVIDDGLRVLSQRYSYVTLTANRASLSDEDVRECIDEVPALRALVRLAEVALRDLYLELLAGDVGAVASLQVAIRQAIALCGRTADIVALRKLIKNLDATLRGTHDQMLYVNIVSEALLSNQDLLDIELRELVSWASDSAYDVGDCPSAASLLELLPSRTRRDDAMLACCYGEMNRHKEAMEIADGLDAKAISPDDRIAAALIRVSSAYAMGNRNEAEALHGALRSDTRLASSALFGFVLRYTEIVQDFPRCTPDLIQSASVLASHGFHKAAAYSDLAAAMNLACEGKIRSARKLIRKATAQLAFQARDRQILLNNCVVVDLLSGSPNVRFDLEQLRSALFATRDDFSRLVLYNNKLICHWLAAEIDQALHATDVIARILDAPGFGNRDVFWPACFNCWRFLVEAGEEARAERFRALPFEEASGNTGYHQYWNVRFDLDSTAPEEFDFLMRFKYHPEYLSHWVIDTEGFGALTTES